MFKEDRMYSLTLIPTIGLCRSVWCTQTGIVFPVFQAIVFHSAFPFGNQDLNLGSSSCKVCTLFLNESLFSGCASNLFDIKEGNLLSPVCLFFKESISEVPFL